MAADYLALPVGLKARAENRERIDQVTDLQTWRVIFHRLPTGPGIRMLQAVAEVLLGIKAFVVRLRDGAKGPLRVEILHRRVWLWDDQEPQARPWRLIVHREIDTPTEIKYSLSNALADTLTPCLALMQGQRH